MDIPDDIGAGIDAETPVMAFSVAIWLSSSTRFIIRIRIPEILAVSLPTSDFSSSRSFCMVWSSMCCWCCAALSLVSTNSSSLYRTFSWSIWLLSSSTCCDSPCSLASSLFFSSSSPARSRCSPSLLASRVKDSYRIKRGHRTCLAFSASSAMERFMSSLILAAPWAFCSSFTS